MAGRPAPIASARCTLVALTPRLLAAMRGAPDGGQPFSWPSWWPDEADLRHLTIWEERAGAAERNITWGPRALVDADGQMLGHAGFHAPPVPIERGLDDPTFVGRHDPAVGGVVEIGYTIFPLHRHRGLASEAVRTLITWAQDTGEVGAVLATVATGNDASVGVLERVGGFAEIGTCRSDDGELEVVYRRDLTSGS